MKRFATLVVTIAVILAAVIACYETAAYSSRTGSDAPAYSTARHDPYGTAALYDLLQERGAAVRNLTTPHLRPDDHGVLIQTLSIASASQKQPGNAPLADWISQGNTVIQLTRGNTALMQRLGVVPTTQPSKEVRDLEQCESRGEDPADAPTDNVIATLNDGAGQDQPTASLLLSSPTSFNASADHAWKALARAGNGDAIAVQYAIGRGRLIVIGSPTPALNSTLAMDGNLDFLLSLIGDQPVIFDEWSHGIGHDATIISFLYEAGLIPLLAQLAFLCLLYGWSVMGMGQPAIEAVARQRSSREQMETLGYLYSRSMDSDVTHARVEAEVTRRLSDALRCRPAEIAARAGTLKPILRERVQNILQRLAQLRPATGPRCEQCGYDLTMNETGKCPECGSSLSLAMRQRIAETKPDLNGPAARRPMRMDAAFAEVLSASHELILEVQRERRAV